MKNLKRTTSGFTAKRESQKRDSDFSFANERRQKTQSSGFTLVELIVSMGLFAVVMLLASGAYLLMIGLNRQAQGIATGIDSLSFAIETMTRDMRTGTGYSCGMVLDAGDCLSGGNSFSFTNAGGDIVSYSLASGAIQVTTDSVTNTLTDPSVTVSSLMFYVVGTDKSDGQQPHVTVTVSGTVSYAAGKSEPFTVETGATMRGTDI